jgi:hypothetical protein
MIPKKPALGLDPTAETGFRRAVIADAVRAGRSPQQLKVHEKHWIPLI